MYIEAVPDRNSPPAILLRESYRENGRVKKRTLCNLTTWPKALVEGFRALLKGGTVVPPGQPALTVRRALPHGHVAAALGTLRAIGLDGMPGPAGNPGDPSTLAAQVSKLKQRFGVEHLALVGDRGMITQTRIDETLRPAGLDWITAWRAPALRRLVAEGSLQLSLCDAHDLATITAPDYPGERLMVCRIYLVGGDGK